MAPSRGLLADAPADTVLGPDELIEFCRPRLAGFKRPKAVVVVDRLPKTVTGKIQRVKVRELAYKLPAIA